jgi:quinone-modifying oxidoreductase subunit QmoB
MSEKFEHKIGAYLCEGCGIKDAINMDALEGAVKNMRLAECARAESYCAGDGYSKIKADVADGKVNQVIVAGCSPRVMVQEFNQVGAQVFRANLREQVIWQQPANNDKTQTLALDNTRMAVQQAKKAEPPKAHWDGASSLKLLVVGGGITGLTAAREASRTGAEVVLVEKGDKLGGWAAKWSKFIPEGAPYHDPQENPVPALIKDVENDPNITVRLNTIVTHTEGGPGAFTAKLQNGASSDWDVFGAIVVATGWRPYESEGQKRFGIGSTEGVITDIEMEERLANGGLRGVNNVVFIIPGDTDRMVYSSGVSDKVAIKQAIQMVENDPNAMCYIIHEHFRSHGTAEEFYRSAQEKGVVFQRGAVKGIAKDRTVTVDDELLGMEIPMSGIDLVVVSTGMVPNSTNIDLEPVKNEKGELKGEIQLKSDVNPLAPIFTINGKPVDEALAKALAAEQAKEPVQPGGPLLNLQYRQGPHIPMLANGFADSHYICFPYETRRSGIYTAGPVRRAMTASEAVNDAQGAVLKAIQAMRQANEARAVHPRAGDLSFPEFGLNICTKCRRCTVECPFGAIDEHPETDYPVLNATRCRRCGTCMGACPVSTISFKNYSPQQVSEMVSAGVEGCESDQPRILVLACENDAYPALDMAGINRRQLNPYMRIIPVRCLGSVTLLWVKTALEKGYDGIMLLGCKSGDDYQCHFVKGSAMAKERMSKVGETLRSMMMEEERVQVNEIAIADSERVVEILNSFGKQIEDIGLNPFKGF